LPVSEATHDSWIDVVHTVIGVGTRAMVFDATPHGARVEIDTPEHGADPLQCPQFENGRAVARHPGRAAVRQSCLGFARDGRCATLLNKCVINDAIT